VLYHVGTAHYERHGNLRIVLTRVSCPPPVSQRDRVFCHLFRGAQEARRFAGRGALLSRLIIPERARNSGRRPSAREQDQPVVLSEVFEVLEVQCGEREAMD
jgi:hypothetical protein